MDLFQTEAKQLFISSCVKFGTWNSAQENVLGSFLGDVQVIWVTNKQVQNLVVHAIPQMNVSDVFPLVLIC